jgi:hypothetical protein
MPEPQRQPPASKLKAGRCAIEHTSEVKMGRLLERAQEMSARNYWKPEKAGDGIEGTVVEINRDIGKFHSTDFVIEGEDRQRWTLSVPKDSVLARRIAEDFPTVGDAMAVLYMGVPSGKKYKSWRIVVEHGKVPRPEGEDGASGDTPPF